MVVVWMRLGDMTMLTLVAGGKAGRWAVVARARGTVLSRRSLGSRVARTPGLAGVPGTSRVARLSGTSGLTWGTRASGFTGLTGTAGFARWALGTGAAVVAELTWGTGGSRATIGTGAAGRTTGTRATWLTSSTRGSGVPVTSGLSGTTGISGLTSGSGESFAGALRRNGKHGLIVASIGTRLTSSAIVTRAPIVAIPTGVAGRAGGSLLAAASLGLSGNTAHEGIGGSALAALRAQLDDLLPQVTVPGLAVVEVTLDGGLEGLNVGEDEGEGNEAGSDGDGGEGDGAEGHRPHAASSFLLAAVHLLIGDHGSPILLVVGVED